MTFQVYQNGERPENLPEISWFDVKQIYETCPAKWKFQEAREQNSSKIADHVAILSPENFAERFLREPIADDYAEVLSTDQQMKDWLKSRGISGYSGKKYDELVSMIDSTSEKPFILKREQQKASDIAYQRNMQLISGSDWDRIMSMRSVFFGNPQFSDRLTNTYNNVMLCGELCGVEVRLSYDAMSSKGEIIDYVSTANVEPSQFMRHIENGGHYIKQAMLHDAFVKTYDRKPSSQIIIAQETKQPFIPVAYRVTDEHLAIGRSQYESALKLLKACIDNDRWVSYSATGELVDLPISPWLKKQYGIEG